MRGNYVYISDKETLSLFQIQKVIKMRGNYVYISDKETLSLFQIQNNY